jgi:hypothetical protein
MRDPKVEQWLNKEGVTWHYEPEVPLTKVDKAASLHNQARFRALNPDHVLELAMAAEEMELPAIVAYYNPDGMLVVIDGNHRLEAYLSLSNKTKSDFYVVDTIHPWVLERLTRVANVLNGEPISREERLMHALYLVQHQNMTIKAAARALMLAPSSLNAALDGEDARARLARLNFSDNLPTGHLQLLYRIKQDKPLLEAAMLVKEASLTREETRELADKLSKAAATEKSQLAVINEFRRKYQDKVALVKKGKIAYRLTPAMRLNRALNTIHSTRRESVEPITVVLSRKIKKAIEILEGLVA